MAFRISGKSVDVGEALRGTAERRLADVLGKYFDGGYDGHVTVEREGSGFRTTCTVHLDSGSVLQAEGRDHDAHQSFERAAEHIEKRLRRYNRRLKEHHAHARRAEAITATDRVIAAGEGEEADEGGGEPAVIAETTTSILSMSVGDAVMAMDLGDLPLLVFRHARHGGINVVYRRRDGNIGWIDPALTTKKGQA
jgi:ribosomal subunit interface protein